MNARFFYRSVDLINSVSKKVVVNNLIKKKDRVLVSFSGGQDSICLLFILNQLYSQMELNLALFWCHHLWQTDSFSLMQQIAKLSFLFQFNNCFAIPSKFISSELLARRWRYDCSYRVSSFYNYYKICLAHTSNDKVETLFLNLMRGTGLSGLSPLRWTQFVPKNTIEKEEHISQIFPAQISPFFWCFLFDKKNFSTQVWKKFWINNKKLKTVFLFCWKPNIYNGTTNLTKLSFFSTRYLCLSPLCSRSSITFSYSSFGRGETNFCFPKIYFYQDISSTSFAKQIFASFANQRFASEGRRASYFVELSLQSLALYVQSYALQEDVTPSIQKLIDSPSFVENRGVAVQSSTSSMLRRAWQEIEGVIVAKQKVCTEVDREEKNFIFNLSTSVQTFCFATITPILIIKSQHSIFSLKVFKPLSPCALKKVVFKKHIRKKFSYNNTKNKKNQTTKRWFNGVSYTFFKACLTYL